MAKKTADSKRQPWEVDFVPCELNKEARAALLKWDVKGEQSFDLVTKMVADGYKLTLSRDERNDCVICSLTSPAPMDGTRKQCLTARGPDFAGALRAVAFKHFVILEGQWTGSDNSFDRNSQWG